MVRQARRRGIAPTTLRRRFRQALQWFVIHSAPPPVPAGRVVLLIDALWFRFRKERWTLYLLALKPLTHSTAWFLDPVVLPGMEALRGWRLALQTLPTALHDRIVALVSDGFRGSHTLAREHGWIHQRCHFHLLADLHGRRGRVQRVRGRPVREALYQHIRHVLVSPDEEDVRWRCEVLHRLVYDPDCPKRLQMYTREFVRNLELFRAYRHHPTLHLPTTNVIEAMANVLRTQLRSISTPHALRQWATAIIRLHPVMVCNGSTKPPN